MKAAICLFLLALIPLTWARPASAQVEDYADAEKAFAQGQLLVDMGETLMGVMELKKAVSIMPLGKYLAGLVQAYRDLGKDEQALVYGERYLSMTDPEARDQALESWISQTLERFRAGKTRLVLRAFPPDAMVSLVRDGEVVRTAITEEPDQGLVWWVDQGEVVVTAALDGYSDLRRELTLKPGDQQELELTLERAQGSGELLVETNIQAAEVRIDGKRAGDAPLRTPLPAGRYVVQVWASGYDPWTGFITILPGKVSRARVQLVAASGAAPAGPRSLEWDKPGGGPSLSTWGWITAGLGLGMLGAGGYTYSVVFNKTTEANEETDPVKRVQLASERDDYYLYTLILAGVGGAAVGGGILMILLDDGGDEQGDATLEILSLGAVPTPGGMVFSADFSF